MKKRVIAVCLTIAMAVTMMACGSEKSDNSSAAGDTTESVQAGTESTQTASKESGRTQLIVGFDAEFPPYGYMDDKGEYTGFDLDLAQEVCDRNGWKLVKKPINWDAKDMELNSGSIDCIWNGFTITGREKDYTWTDPYVDNSIVVVVREDSNVKKLDDLAGKVVAVQSDSSGLTALTSKDNNDKNLALAASFKELQQVADYNTAFMNLESGAVQAIVLDIGVAKYQVNSRGDKFKILEDKLSTEQYGVGFKLGNTSLRDKVQETLYEMVADGTLGAIADKYSKYNLSQMICLGQK
jgi:polar amino acid transport system substrate-binding protein